MQLRLICFLVSAMASLVSAQSVSRIESTEGTAEKIDALGRKHPAARGITLKNGETLTTSQGALASLRLCPTMSLGLRENSSATLVQINTPGRIVKALGGSISFLVTPKPGASLEVQTAFFLCTCSAGVFRLDLDRDQAVISVSKGKIAILDSETRALKMEVLHGETAMIGAPYRDDSPSLDNEGGAAGTAAAESLATAPR